MLVDKSQIVQNERMYYAVYNCNWYLLPVKMQRVFLVLLLRTQTPTVLKSGTIELDLNLFVAVSDDSHTKHLIRTLSIMILQVMKNIYSVGMLLLESVE